MNPLRKFAEESGLTWRQIGVLVKSAGFEVTPLHLAHVAFNHKNASKALARAVERALEGKVSAAALVMHEPDEEDTRPPRRGRPRKNTPPSLPVTARAAK